MSYSEREIPLSDIDLQELKAEKKAVLKYVIGFSLFGVVLLSFVVISISKDVLSFIICGFFLCVLVFIMTFLYRKWVSGYTKDINAGIKLVVDGTLVNKEEEIVKSGSGMKRATEHYYKLVFDKRKINVDEEQYNMVSQGNRIHIEFATHSDTIFNFRVS